MKIRHEINLLNSSLVQSSTSTQISSGEQVLFNPVSYSGSLSTYLEVVVTNTSTSEAIVELAPVTTGASVQVAVPGSTTSFTILRSVNFSNLLSGSVAFLTRIYALASAGTVTVKTARLIIIQDTGTADPTASETQIELGNRELNRTLTAATTVYALNSPKYYKHNAANWSGSVAAFAEVVAAGSSTSHTKTIYLQSSTDLVNWTNVSTIASGAMSITPTRYGRLSFNLFDGTYYRIGVSMSSTMSTVSIYAAKIVIQQNPAIAQNYLLETGGSSAAIGNFGQLGVAQTFTASGNHSLQGIGLQVTRVGTNSGNSTRLLVAEIRQGSPTGTILATSGNILLSSLPTDRISGGYSYFTFSQAIVLASGQVYALTVRFTTNTDNGTEYANVWGANPSAYAGGDGYVLFGGGWSVQSNDFNFALATQFPNKLEAQYMLLNTNAFSIGNTPQKWLTQWNPAEWVGCTNTYNHAVSSVTSSAYGLQVETVAGVLVMNSLVSNPASYKASEPLVMPSTAQVLDLRGQPDINASGFYGSVILVAVTKEDPIIQENLILYPETLNEPNNWSKLGVTVENTLVSAPQGSQAMKLVEAATNSLHCFFQEIPVVNSVTGYNLSVYLKAESLFNVRLYIEEPGTGNRGTADFNILQGTIGGLGYLTGGTTKAYITALADNWYRCAIRVTGLPGIAAYAGVYFLNAGNTIYQGNTSVKMPAWGFMVNRGGGAAVYTALPTTPPVGLPRRILVIS